MPHPELAWICRDCGGETTTFRSRLCDPCRKAQQRGVGEDQWLDRHGQPYWTKERIIRAIRSWKRTHGQPPIAKEWGRGSIGRKGPVAAAQREWPSVGSVQIAFGSWNAAIEAAGFQPRTRGRQRNLKTCLSGKHRWNPYVTPAGKAQCRECRRENDLRFKARRRKARA